ncbi:GNAT family N-acetyltransferase [Streptomyces sp. NPDC053741]|uniref:GCN5-related N-acetyltransferase n=1 Tax=Streptomyces pratensis (strain ATCC 33331 / IAF-45CD) TaxID=591167 RepID=A0A8D3WK93_STRFA|nr:MULTISPECIES: GNAT family N-acetyltransferase [Streptomyces]MDF9872178.1 diamine N-acetyltransferase [Streptomyces pratensis]RAS36181.1 diamine N-acetyltransferase [Streptomyces avidinii]SNX71845.1 diamine N-acetyltransferase [Streptomyces microflavus]AGJ55185.1 acetyltransferase [Streptomyces sp. PAMC 26508]MCY1651765.1 GNAT family N-acetyltransferase [Streptomyces sp. SL203]
MTAQLRLEKVTPDNVLDACRLKVAPEQERFVAPVARSLAEAYADPGTAWPRLIFDGERLVGFVMAFLDVRFHPEDPDDRPRSGLWRLAVAAGEQGRGYGRFAVDEVCAEIRRRGGSRVTVTWGEGEHGPEEFYLKLGFRRTGEMSGGQVVGELDLPLG